MADLDETRSISSYKTVHSPATSSGQLTSNIRDEGNDESLLQIGVCVNENEATAGEMKKKEVEMEPKLTYDRIGNDVANILQKDTASCLAVFEKFIAIGTLMGKVYIFDFQGNLWSGGKIHMHRVSINQISIDNKGEFIASCSDERIVISEIYSGLSVHVTNLDHAVKNISIDPVFASNSYKRFAIGDRDQLLLYEKNLLGRYKFSSLQQSRGLIRSITWRQNFLAWSSDLCIKIYDVLGKNYITHIARDKESDYRVKSDLCQCSFCWKDDLTLLAAWGSFIKMCCIKVRSHDSELSLASITSSDRLPKYYVELVYAFNIQSNLIACGIAPFERQLMIMCTNKSMFYPTIDDAAVNEKKLIQIKLVEPLNADLFNNVSDDALLPKDFAKTVAKSKDLTFAYLQSENFYFVLSPKDLILAKPREEDDHIDWLIERGKFAEALERVKGGGEKRCSQHTVESVGTLYIDHLFGRATNESFEEAAQLCHTICGHNQPLWQREVFRFNKAGALRFLAKHLPLGPEFVLESDVYELVLNQFLETDPIAFLSLVQSWPPSLYSTASLIKATIDQLSSQQNDLHLLEALGQLYAYECRYQKALFLFLQVGNAKKVFELIWAHQLLHLLEDRIVQLLELDAEETSRLLINHQDSIPSEKVVARLQEHPRLLCTYLDRLIHRDPATGATYHDLLFDLYSTYAPDKLVPLLRQSNFIQLDKALEVCRKRNLTQAIVFILGRMGNTHEALRIITDQTDDINAAIEFCKEHGDADLWSELMDISVCKPQLLSTLLREVSTYATDPISLIARIPEGLVVPELMSSLVRILQDYRLQVTLEDGCRRVLYSDCYNLLAKLTKMRTRAFASRGNSLCQGCQRAVNTSNVIYASDLILFQCGHIFHRNCLLHDELNPILCLVCNTIKKRNH